MVTDAHTQFTQTAAAIALDAEHPPAVDTLRRWHDRVGGPRDIYGRRVWNTDVVERIREAREKARKAAG